ncbi:hypothetical protein HO133_010872 [Letharia lupina]|uniref:Uncharacterized protein n=1 Tax=Letharia lupina TaxID=560253 RepID=A0A8H6CIV1_9LECA|nr:uncharacterized protein HO133_010872 [Letharia lupina]KAF6224297.1 hypothetical protein HO133_010872 [Letharia lupina]
MCAAMITRLAKFASLTALVLASPIPDNSDIIGCVNSWDSWGIACPNLGHHLFCDNLPGVRAGSGASQTRMKRRKQFEPLNKSPHILQTRKNDDGTTYCQAQTNTFVVVISFNAANAAVSSFLSACLNAVQTIINNGNTGLIPNDGWYGPLGRNGVSMTVWSENDYQTTYGVLHSTIQALIGWMSSNDNTFGTGSFTVWDGDHQVGHGSING